MVVSKYSEKHATKVIVTFQYISHGVLGAGNEAYICHHSGSFKKKYVDLTSFFSKNDSYKRTVFNIQIFKVSKFPSEVSRKNA